MTADQLRYAALDAAILVPLHEHQRRAIAAEGLERVAAIESACVPTLAWQAYAAMPFAGEAWRQLSDAAVLEQQGLKRQLGATLAPAGANQFGGFKFSPDSPAQVGLLMERLGVQVPRNEHGHTVVDEAALLAVREAHPVVRLLLAYRDASKRASVYGIQFVTRHVHPVTGRIHADYRQIGAASGRMSCADPNLQNIPRTKPYRACFRPQDGRVFVKADYAQIELRLAAVIAGDEAMLGAYCEGADLHTRTAAAVLGIPEADVTKEHRQLAKALNLASFMGWAARRWRSTRQPATASR